MTKISPRQRRLRARHRENVSTTQRCVVLCAGGVSLRESVRPLLAVMLGPPLLCERIKIGCGFLQHRSSRYTFAVRRVVPGV